MKPARIADLTFRRVEELETNMGLRHERGLGHSRPMAAATRDLIFFPRASCRARVRMERPRALHEINSTQILFVPRGLPFELTARSTIFDAVSLFPNEEFSAQFITENGLSQSDDKFLRSRSFKLRRSRWLDDLIERYVFERVYNRHSPVGCPFFLEKQMMNELARLIFKNELQTHGDVLGEEPADIATKARQYIEARVFDRIGIEDICRDIGCSASTLTRSFKDSFSTSPGAYLRDRRLDEAAMLIERGEHAIGDIGMLVGYEDLSAFTRAFKVRFEAPPTAWRELSHEGLYTGKRPGVKRLG